MILPYNSQDKQTIIPELYSYNPDAQKGRRPESIITAIHESYGLSL